MIAAWQKKQGAPDTGFLTAPQVATLRQAATAALARYETEKRRLDDTAIRAARSAPAPAPGTAWRGSARLPLPGGSDAIAEYTLNLNVTSTDVSGTVTRYCPSCLATGDTQRQTYTCAPSARRAEHTVSLRCEGIVVWGPLEQPRIDDGRHVVAVPLARADGPGD
jgi:hypothetical protein